MSFHYRKKQHGDNQDAMWTSYSDLFLGLSVIFLLLYVTASLRQGTDGIKQYLENKQLEKENSDLKQQLKVYNSLKENYLETQANENDKATYDMLMDKIKLLKDEAGAEKDRLQAAAKENAQKEQALNQYQQIVRNIVNANMLAKARIQNRDVVIDKKEDVINEQSSEIATLEDDLREKSAQVASGRSKIEKLEKNLSSHLAELKAAYNQKKITEKKYKEQYEVFKQDAAARIASLKDQNLQREAEIADIKAKQGSLENKLAATEGKAAGLSNQLKATEKALGQARENLYARKKLAQSIKDKFQANGIKAEVDGNTGDVLIDFGAEYFDTGAAKLKPGMRNVLEKALPAYAQSLFADPNISKKIENVEIVGFASPTFKGKYIDPGSLSKKDRLAVNYNLDLSYKRARSIFDYLYSNMDFEKKQQLLPLVKVTGRSFLGDKDNRSPTATTASQYCETNDCAKKQTVIIKFKLRD